MLKVCVDLIVLRNTVTSREVYYCFKKWREWHYKDYYNKCNIHNFSIYIDKVTLTRWYKVLSYTPLRAELCKPVQNREVI